MAYCKEWFPKEWDPNGQGGHFAKPVEDLALETFAPDVSIENLETNIARPVLHELTHCKPLTGAGRLSMYIS